MIILDSRPSNNAHHDASDEDDGFESEEADLPSGKGFFAQQVRGGINDYIAVNQIIVSGYVPWRHRCVF